MIFELGAIYTGRELTRRTVENKVPANSVIVVVDALGSPIASGSGWETSPYVWNKDDSVWQSFGLPSPVAGVARLSNEKYYKVVYVGPIIVDVPKVGDIINSDDDSTAAQKFKLLPVNSVIIGKFSRTAYQKNNATTWKSSTGISSGNDGLFNEYEVLVVGGVVPF